MLKLELTDEEYNITKLRDISFIYTARAGKVEYHIP